MNRTQAIRAGALVAGGIAYAVLAHYSTATSAATTRPALGVAVSLLPALAILLWLTWRAPRRLPLLLVCAMTGGLLWQFWGALERNFGWVYFLQHVATNLMLAAVFGTTLMQGRKALCTHFAETVHGSLAPDVARYSRQITLAWTLFFLAIALVSCVLFSFFGIATWSVFANFLTFPLILLMFAVEYRVRLRMLPNLEKHSILDGVRAFMNQSAAPRPTELAGTPPRAP
jgi:uncharacterized membrane protein